MTAKYLSRCITPEFLNVFQEYSVVFERNLLEKWAPIEGRPKGVTKGKGKARPSNATGRSQRYVL
jgi:hypothetical protein